MFHYNIEIISNIYENYNYFHTNIYLNLILKLQLTANFIFNLERIPICFFNEFDCNIYLKYNFNSFTYIFFSSANNIFLYSAPFG